MKGRIERLFETLQDRLVKQMRLGGVDTIVEANDFLRLPFLPQWEERFTVVPRQSHGICPIGVLFRLQIGLE